MNIVRLRFLPVFFAVLFAPLFVATTCQKDRVLDPAGSYGGDKLLFDYDGIIVETTKTFQEVVALADRNAAFVAARPELAEKVAKIRAEIDGVAHDNETLVRLHTARDAYLAVRSRSTSEALRGELVTARTLLETARAILPLLVNPNP